MHCLSCASVIGGSTSSSGAIGSQQRKKHMQIHLRVPRLNNSRRERRCVNGKMHFYAKWQWINKSKYFELIYLNIFQTDDANRISESHFVSFYFWSTKNVRPAARTFGCITEIVTIPEIEHFHCYLYFYYYFSSFPFQLMSKWRMNCWNLLNSIFNT